MKRILMVLAATIVCSGTLLTACSHNGNDGKTDAKESPRRDYVCDDNIDAHEIARWLRDYYEKVELEEEWMEQPHSGLD